jgi:Zn-dependent peptidase ImmA (M78 family)/transcriptional regulator with XRE-family HTH domain
MMEKSKSKSSGVDEMEAVQFNPKRFSIARKRRGYTKTEVAKKLNVSLRAVTAYESGDYLPSDEILDKLESVLGFPKEFFAGDDLDEPEVFAVSFRSLSKMSAKMRDMALSQGALAIHFAQWLDRKFELPPCSLPNLSTESNPEAAAEAVREEWGIGQLPVRNMIHLLESKGVRVFSLSLDVRELDAFSTWKGDVPFIFLNNNKSAEHSRFDAAHELGHLVMHKHGGPNGRDVEADANQFASAFLMPRGSVLGHAPKFTTIFELFRLKKIWLTSMTATCHRLHELGLLSDWQYKVLCIELSKRGYRIHEPDGVPRESSLILPMLFGNLYQQDGIGRSRIADELQIPVSELESLMFSLVMTSVSGGRNAPRKPGNPALLNRVK